MSNYSRNYVKCINCGYPIDKRKQMALDHLCNACRRKLKEIIERKGK